MSMDGITKEAQSRSVFKQLGRALNPMEYVRYYGSSAYRRVYDTITEVDSDIREVANAQKPQLRDWLHQARMAMKNREYPKVMYYAWKIFEGVDGIFYSVHQLEELRREMLSEYYEQGGLDQSQLGEMDQALGQPAQQGLEQQPVQVPKAASLTKLLYTTAAPNTNSLVTEAGVQQWLQENIPSWRQMEGAMLDKIFRNKMGKQRESARKALRMAERIFTTLPQVFQQLDSARTDFSSYLSTVQRFQKSFEDQKQQLSALYQENFANTVDEMMEGAPQGAPQQPDVTVEQEPRNPDVATPEQEPDPAAAAAQGQVAEQQAAQQAAEEARQPAQKAASLETLAQEIIGYSRGF